MNERERLIELIGSAVYSPTKGCLRTIGSKCNSSLIEAIADYLLAHGVTVQEWIPVTERLPEDWCPVLVIVREVEKPLLGSYRENVWFHEAWNTTFVNGAVTHWMPFPNRRRRKHDGC